jgi:hypothetical protein
MIYVKKYVEVIIFMSVSGTVSAKTETCCTFLLCAVARANYIDDNTTRKNGQIDDRIAVGDPWSDVFDWFNRDI